MILQLLVSLAIALIIAVGIVAADLAYDRGLPNYASRKIGHLGAGVGLTVGALLLDGAWWAVGIAGVFAVGFCGLRLWAPWVLRGIGGTGRPHAIAELWFPIVCTAALALGWGWMGSRWLGTAPCLFLALGDTATGLVRNWHCKKEKKGWCGTGAMLVVCLALAALIQPYWIGALGAVVATVAEKLTTTRRFLDDNLTLTAGSAATMAVAYWLARG